MIKQLALNYLGYRNQLIDASMDQLIDECIEEVKEKSNFKVLSASFHYQDNTIVELDLSLNSEDTKIYFNGCNQILVNGYTLGMELERYLRGLAKINMSKYVIADSVASAYLEYKANEYDQSIKEPRTYRFAPGYGDLPLELNEKLYYLLNLNKNLGITLTPGGLFLPQKSMLCLIGIGHSNLTKSCGNCIKYKNCFLRKENLRCWND